MGLWDDERAQSIQIGAVLLFAMLIVAFSTYQAFVVPNQNREVEFNHNQEVHERMGDLRNAIVSMPGDGGTRSVSVQLGTTYPSRAVAVNPGPPSGTLRTAGSADTAVNVSIRNATATDSETDDYWSGTARNYSTGAIVYSPQYNLYNNAPETVYDQTVLYDQFRSANVTLANQTFIDGNEISLVTLNGSFSRSSSGSATVDVRSVTASTQTVEVESASASKPVTLVFASKRDHTYWTFLEAKSNVDSVVGADSEVPSGYEGVKITLATGPTYDLQLTKVGVGSGVTEEDTAYLTAVEGNNSRLREDETTELVLELRNRYNHAPNNSSATTVYAEADQGTIEGSTQQTPDSDGRVRFVYNGTTAGVTDQVNVSYVSSAAVADPSFDPDSVDNVTMSVDVKSTGSGGSSGSTGAGESGTSTYSSNDDSEVVADENGRWDDIQYTDQMRFSGTETVIDHSNGYLKLETEFTVRNETSDTEYSVNLRIEKQASGEYNTKRVSITEVIRGGSTNTGSTQTITETAAERVVNESVYNGTNVLNPEIYTDSLDYSSGNFGSYIKKMTDMDGSDVTLVFSEQTGRTTLTLWDRTLITAVEPNPDSPAALDNGDKGEFVALHLRSEVDVNGWTIEDDEGDTTDLSAAGTIGPGTYYFAKNETEFESQRQIADNRVYGLDTELDDDGDALKLIDSDGDLRDEIAYANGSSPSTSSGTTVSNVGKGEVLNRTGDGVFKEDDDTARNWKVEDELDYFSQTPNNGVAFTGGGSVRSYAANEVVTTYSQSAAAVGSKTVDFDNDGEADVPFTNASGKRPGVYVTDSSSTRKVTASGSLNQKTTNLGVGDFDQDGDDEVYFIKDSNGKIRRGEPGNSNDVVNADAIAIAGLGDLDDDGNTEIAFLSESGSLKYVDDDESIVDTGYTDIGNTTVGGNPSYGVGTPVDYDGDGEAEVPVVKDNGDLVMVDRNGNVDSTVLDTGVTESSVAAFDIDADTDTELVYLNDNDELTSYDFSDDSSTVLVDTADNTIVADTGVGVR